ncbi:MAG TPA: PilW family protein [Gammaproteobacteria bacterium]|nr:PilW family protein [Gammaproteobacteria bacterium]
MQTRSHAGRQSGMSLIELMIALVISLVLMAGVISVFVSSKRSYGTNTAVAQVQEDARFALNFITPTVRMAGYSGCGKSINLTSILNGGLSAFNFGNGMGGYEAAGTNPGSTYVMGTSSSTPFSPALDTSFAAAGIVPVQGSDVVVIYGTSGNPVAVNQFNPSNDTFKMVNGTPASNGLYNTEIGVITDCVKGDVFQMTNTTGSQVQHSKNNSIVPGNATGKFPDQFGANAQLVFPNTWLFYIGTGADGGSSLFQADLNGGGGNSLLPKELVSGIDNMQVMYGIDPLGDGTTGYYTTADVVNTNNLWNNVISVEIALLVRSAPGAVAKPATAVTYNLLGTSITAPLDTCLRHVFTTTIGIRNRLQ